MKREKIQAITGLLFGALVFGIIFTFTGCGIGDLIKIYDPTTMEYKKWTPYNMYFTDQNPARGNKIRLLTAFYKTFPETARSRITNEDVLKKVDEYCSAKRSGYSKKQMAQLVKQQIDHIRNQPGLTSIADELTLRLETVYVLSDEYVCPHDSLSRTFADSKAVGLYLEAVKQKGFDKNVIDEEGKADLDRTLLLAGRTACEEIGQNGYQKALEQKLKDFSSRQNIKAVYSSAYEHLCPSTSTP
jgi:hypothetical protein